MAFRIGTATVAAAIALHPTVASCANVSVAPPCSLSTDDLKSLALSPSHLTEQDYETSLPERQKMVCKTRNAIRQLDLAKGVITAENSDQIMAYSAKYLSPSENDRMVDAGDNFLNELMKKKGY